MSASPRNFLRHADLSGTRGRVSGGLGIVLFILLGALGWAYGDLASLDFDHPPTLIFPEGDSIDLELDYGDPFKTGEIQFNVYGATPTSLILADPKLQVLLYVLPPRGDDSSGMYFWSSDCFGLNQLLCSRSLQIIALSADGAMNQKTVQVRLLRADSVCESSKLLQAKPVGSSPFPGRAAWLYPPGARDSSYEVVYSGGYASLERYSLSYKADSLEPRLLYNRHFVRRLSARAKPRTSPEALRLARTAQGVEIAYAFDTVPTLHLVAIPHTPIPLQAVLNVVVTNGVREGTLTISPEHLALICPDQDCQLLAVAAGQHSNALEWNLTE